MKGYLMIKQTRVHVAILGAVAMLSLAACNGGSSSINPFTPSRGTLRVINASPDAGPIDVAIGVAGRPNFTSVSYAGTATGGVGISQYVQFNAPTQNVFVYHAGQDSTPISLNMASVTIVPNGRNTLVLVGESAKGTLKLVNFTEHLFTTAAASAAVSFHHAAPSFASTYTVGYYPIATPTQTTSIGSISYPSNQPTFLQPLPANVASAGIGFSASSGATSVTLTPSQVDPNDTANQMPFNFNGNPNADQNLSIYLIDGPTPVAAPKLIGVFDPDN
jgi:hypothetical protein